MTREPERIRYYDGEYLRAFDFSAEQAYHVEMRRRLNLALHLQGIVDGLQLTESANAGIAQVSVSPGMAIDALGREILLLAPYTFADVDDVQANRITLPGEYDVWLRYVRVAITPPSAGYAACNQANEATRWRENCSIVLRKSDSSKRAPAVTQVTDEISESESGTDSSSSGGVFLGVVSVTPDAAGGAFHLPSQPTGDLTYIGLRAQHVRPPDFPDTVSKAFDITSKAGALQPPLGVEVESNLFADQNLVVGANFAVNLPNGTPAPAPAGNVKVAGNLFLDNGVWLYRNAAGAPAWMTLEQLIDSRTPDILVGTAKMSPSPSGQPNGAFTLSALPSRLPRIGSVLATASIAGIQFSATGTVTTLLTTVPLTPLQVQITSVNAANSRACDVTVYWSVAPTATVPSFASPIQDIWISYVVVCYPPTST
jgi:hypothetical protein